nr:hypothetical protein [Tanacetum cinerariifolium]
LLVDLPEIDLLEMGIQYEEANGACFCVGESDLGSWGVVRSGGVAGERESGGLQGLAGKLDSALAVAV